MLNQQKQDERKLAHWGLWLGPVLGLGLIALGDLEPGHPEVTRAAGVACWMAIWWMTEAVPLAATALLPVALFPLFGVMSGREVAPLYFNHIIFLFVGGFMVALAMQRWDLHRRIALRLLLLFGGCQRCTLTGFMLVTAFLSMWISNTATTMMMVPIALAIVVKMEEQSGADSSFGTAVFLGVAYAASIGGIATLVGTPPNAIVFGTDRVSMRDMARVGVVLNVIGAVLITVAIAVVGRVVLGVMPEWARLN